AAAHVVSTLLVACPDLSVLATSREALNVTGEMVLPVRPLSVDSDALLLFANLLTRVSPSFALTHETANRPFACAGDSTVCRWRSSWLQLASTSSPYRRSSSVSTSGLHSSARLVGARPRGTRRCARWWTGATSCSRRLSNSCSRS